MSSEQTTMERMAELNDRFIAYAGIDGSNLSDGTPMWQAGYDLLELIKSGDTGASDAMQELVLEKAEIREITKTCLTSQITARLDAFEELEDADQDAQRSDFSIELGPQQGMLGIAEELDIDTSDFGVRMNELNLL